MRLRDAERCIVLTRDSGGLEPQENLADPPNDVQGLPIQCGCTVQQLGLQPLRCLEASIAKGTSSR